MNELRWILLIAGILLIVGLYAWGMRSRTRAGLAEPVKKPAVFTGKADSFETESPEMEVDEAPPPAETRRIEPSMPSADPDATYAPRGSERTAAIGDIRTGPSVGAARREPTWSTRDAAAAPASRPAVHSGDTRIEPSYSAPEPAAARADERDEPGQRDAKADDPSAAPAPARPAQKIVAMRVNAVAPARLDGARLRDAIMAEGLEFGRYDIFHRLHTNGRPIFSVASLREPGSFDLEAMPTTAYPGVALFTVLPGPVSAAEAVDEMVFTARALAAQLGGALADERGAPLTPLRVGRLRQDALEFERGGGPA
jgi:cell division protein ZipA